MQQHGAFLAPNNIITRRQLEDPHSKKRSYLKSRQQEGMFCRAAVLRIDRKECCLIQLRFPVIYRLPLQCAFFGYRI